MSLLLLRNSMHILVFIHSLSAGGAERVTATLANYWADHGHHVILVTMTSQNDDFYELHPEIKRVALNCATDSTNVFAALYHNVKRVLILRRVLVREQADVALGMMTTANCLLALAAIGTGIPAIGSERVHPPALPLGILWEWLRRKSYPHLHAMVALATQSADWLQLHARARRTIIIPNPISFPLPKHSPVVLPEECHLKGEKLLLAVGRLAPQKGYSRLLEAFACLAADFPEWDLVIVGEGSERSRLEQQVIELTLHGRVSFPGRVGNIGDWYEAADLYVMTSLFEGFPNTLAEALAHGVPSVSVDCDTGPRDILRHEVDGLLVPQGDEDSLKKALGSLMRDDALRHKFTERAVEIRQRFSMEKIGKMWEELFAAVSLG